MDYYEIKNYDNAARLGRITTPHGVINTPYLFPVIDPTRQPVSLDEIKSMGFNAIITNAYLYYRRTRGKGGPIHSYLKWNNPVMTDSGGYQVLIYGDVEIDNKTIVEFEKKIGVDIGVILDIPTGSHMTRESARKALEETYRRAAEALPWIQGTDTLWVLPIQGAPYPDLLVYSSIRAWRYPYHIHALGSPTVLLEQYRYAEIIEMVALARLHLPPWKPLHVFGVGHPMIIPFLVALGADLFDSASYILYARDGRYLTSTGTKRLDELDYFPCNCPVCSRYTPRDLMEMPRHIREKLLAIHNLYTISLEIKKTKQAIREGRLYELLEEKSYSHPSLRDAMAVVKKYLGYIIRYSPRTKPRGHAVFLLGEDSLYNPYIAHFRKDAEGAGGGCDILIPAYEKPFSEQACYRDYSSRIPNKDICFYNPYLGIFTDKLANTFPAFQHESPRLNVPGLNTLASNLLEEKRHVIIGASGWMLELAKQVINALTQKHAPDTLIEIYE